MGVDVMERFEAVLEHAASANPDAIFLTGDFCAQEPKEWAFEWLAPKLNGLGIPYVVLPGNHDDRVMMRRHFELPGHENEPILQQLELKGQQFVFLDTRYGELEEGQLNWLEARMKAHPSSVVVMHHPPILVGQPFMDNNYALRNTGRLAEIFRAAVVPVHVFCGHYHSGKTVQQGNVVVHLCPPTSFFIKPHAEEFEQDYLPAAYQQLVWTDEKQLRVTPVYLTEGAAVPGS